MRKVNADDLYHVKTCLPHRAAPMISFSTSRTVDSEPWVLMIYLLLGRGMCNPSTLCYPKADPAIQLQIYS